ncbi:hypothetical protein BDK51DRAFT_28675, partial [Blyttiomyces helicus]
QKALHVSSERNKTSGCPGWERCSNPPGNALSNDSPFSQQLMLTSLTPRQLLPKIIESGIATFLYDGMLDFSLHYKGVEAVIGTPPGTALPASITRTRAISILRPSPAPAFTITQSPARPRDSHVLAALSALQHLLRSKHTYIPGKGVNFDLAKIGQPAYVTSLPPGAIPSPNNTLASSFRFGARFGF